jgi:hypothetical protein
MVVMGSYGTRPARLAVNSRLARLIKSQRLRTLWRLYSCDTLREGLAQHLEHVAPERRQLIQEEDAVMRQGPLTRHLYLAPPDQPDIGDGVMRGSG